MKIKTSELTGAALDWAVAKAEGDRVFRPRLGRPDDWDKAAYLEDGADDRWVVRVQNPTVARFVDWTYSPSTNWSQGGPIIEREEIELGLSSPDVGGWFSCMNNDIHSPEMLYYAAGPTPLIAAMRCYVASKLGDEVDVPEKLI